MQHGYFDDFRAVRDQQGKIFASPNRLIDAQVAQQFPPTQVPTALSLSTQQTVAETVAERPCITRKMLITDCIAIQCNH